PPEPIPTSAPEPPAEANTPSDAQRASSTRSSLASAILLGLIAQALVICWIAASEVPAKVFISSWSFSMPGILVLSVLLLARRFAGRWRERWLSSRQVLLVYV